MMRSTITLILISCTTIVLSKQPFKGSKAVVKSELIYQTEAVPFPNSHASTIAETKDGLIASWFGGTAEKNPDVGIWVSRFTNDKWTVPVEVANGIQHKNLRYPTWNPVLFSNDNKIYLFYKVGPSPSAWWGEIITSDDEGETWSPPCRLPEEIFGPIKNKPVLLSSGELISPSSTENDGWRVHMEITPDMGKHWEKIPPANDGKKTSAIQPTLLNHRDGKLQMLCRSKNKMILSSWSSNNGRTWSELDPIELPNPNSGIDAVTMKNGRHVLIYNHIQTDAKWGDRNILNMAVSDDGIHWQAAVLLENDPDPEAEYSYPAVIQTEDGLIHITYTWNRKSIKHVVVDPSKLKPEPIINGIWPTK